MFYGISLLMIKKHNWLRRIWSCMNDGLHCRQWSSSVFCLPLRTPPSLWCAPHLSFNTHLILRFQFAVSKHVLCWQALPTFTWSKQRFLSTPGILLQPAVQSCCQVLQVQYHLRLELAQTVYLCITELRPKVLSWRALPADACQGACPLFSSKVAVARSYWFSYKGQFGRMFSLH